MVPQENHNDDSENKTQEDQSNVSGSTLNRRQFLWKIGTLTFGVVLGDLILGIRDGRAADCCKEAADAACGATESDERCGSSDPDGHCQNYSDAPHDSDESCIIGGSATDEACSDCNDNHDSDEHCVKSESINDSDEMCGHEHLHINPFDPGDQDGHCSATVSDAGCGKHDSQLDGYWVDPDQYCTGGHPDANCSSSQTTDANCSQGNYYTSCPDEKCGSGDNDAACEAWYDEDNNCNIYQEPDDSCGSNEFGYLDTDANCGIGEYPNTDIDHTTIYPPHQGPPAA